MGRDTEQPPNIEDMGGPVRWLLSRKLIAGLKGILLYAILGDRISGKDWMTGRVHDFTRQPEPREFWFDYIADTGDSPRAVYELARLCLSDLSVHGAAEPGPTGERVVKPAGPNARGAVLPRGEFLFVGGDSAYHVADLRTLTERFQQPVAWAAKALSRERGAPIPRRPIFAIPGNHDYYDALDGFNRQFRQPAKRSKIEGGERKRRAQLNLPGFVRRQQASYVALELPFGWTLLGLDTQAGKADFRQLAFFAEQLSRSGRERLIVTTPEPLTVYGAPIPHDAEILRTMEALGLPCPLAAEEGDRGVVLPGACRLDLAGDLHHYSRTGGATVAGVHNPDGHQQIPNYASVVSGLGGAFLHPTHVCHGDLKRGPVFPSEQESRTETNRRLFNPWLVITGGNVLLICIFLWLVLLTAAHGAPRALLSVAVEQLGSTPMYRGLFQPDWLVGVDVAQTFKAYWGMVASALMLGFAFWASKKHKDAVRKAQTQKVAKPPLPVVSHLAVAAIPILFVLTHLEPADLTQPGQLAKSGLFWGYLALGGALIYFASYFKEMLFVHTRLWAVPLHWAHRVTRLFIYLVAGAASSMAIGRYGELFLRATAFDALIFLVVLGLPLALVALAVSVGASGRRWPVKLGFAVLGLLHAGMQLGIPILWTRGVSVRGALLCLPLVGLANVAGYYLAKASRRWALLGAWLVTAGAVIGISQLHAEPVKAELGSVLLFAAASVLGVFWFQWYLAVSLAFNGHANEAGSVARIDRFVTLIRFKLTRQELRGYVIVRRRPEPSGAEDDGIRLFDEFTIRP